MDRNIYWIGGSTCCGKSTIAERLSREYGMHYLRIDDFMDEHMKRAVADGSALAARIQAMSCDEMWLREPAVLVEEEIEYYSGEFSYILEDIGRLDTDKPVIAEAAALLPHLMAGIGVSPSRYVCMVPDKDFQYEKYAQRPWIDMIIGESSDRERAFTNWMERDALFALHVLEEAKAHGYATIVTTNATPLEENLRRVKEIFGLEAPQ